MGGGLGASGDGARQGQEKPAGRGVLSAEDDAKLVFGTVFSLRNMVRKLGGPDDEWVSASLFFFLGFLSTGVGCGGGCEDRRKN